MTVNEASGTNETREANEVCDELEAHEAKGSHLCVARLARLRERMAEDGLDALYLRGTTNIAWVTAFQGVFDEEQAHALLVLPSKVVLHTDSRYGSAFRAIADGAPIEIDEHRADHFAFLLELLGESGKPCTIGFEDTLTVREHDCMLHSLEECAIPHALVKTSGFVEALRASKDEAEIALMAEAQAITDAGFTHIIGYMKPGMTERQVQLELDRFMLDAGADGLAFPTIVATGAHAASPHAQPGQTILMPGECVVMDFGARKGGYGSDMTRTVFLGKPEGKLLAAWDTLRRANEECEAMVRAGVTGAAVHEHAETVLAEGGFGGAMGHSLGHSVGLDIHEFPNLAPSNDQPLPEGAVLTVEPGIYLEGEFGMRLEDYGVVRADGYEVLTKSTHEMVIIDGRY